MKTIIKILIFVMAISFTMVSTSCSKKSSGYRYNSGSKHATTSNDPASRKQQPLRKKYIINGKKRSILGQETPRRSI